MTDERVGESKNGTKDALTITAMYFAPVIGAFLATVITIIAMFATKTAPPYMGGTSITLTIFMSAIFGAIFGWPSAFLLGRPVHAVLLRRGLTSPLIYIGLATTLALLLMSVLAMALPFYFQSFGVMLSLFAISGAISGLVFWLIRRPDRDAVRHPQK